MEAGPSAPDHASSMDNSGAETSSTAESACTEKENTANERIHFPIYIKHYYTYSLRKKDLVEKPKIWFDFIPNAYFSSNLFDIFSKSVLHYCKSTAVMQVLCEWQEQEEVLFTHA